MIALRCVNIVRTMSTSPYLRMSTITNAPADWRITRIRNICVCDGASESLKSGRASECVLFAYASSVSNTLTAAYKNENLQDSHNRLASMMNS